MTTVRPVILLLMTVLVLSLAINAFCAVKLIALEAKLAHVQSQLSSSLQSARSEIAGLRSNLSSMRQAAQWYTTPQVEIVGLEEPGDAPFARVTWTFQELVATANVGLSYRIAGAEWQDVVPVRVAGNTYEARVPLAGVNQSPMIMGSVHSASGKPQRAVQVEAEGIGGRSMLLEYVIHAKDGASSRSGDTERISLPKLALRLSAEVTDTDGQSYPVMVRLDSPGLGKVAVKQVSAAALSRDAVVLSMDLAADPSGAKAWTGVLRLQSGATADAVRITVTMSDGTVVTRDIYVR